MKKHRITLSFLSLLCVTFLSACSTNPLASGYRSAGGVPKRDWQNLSPGLIQVPISDHNNAVAGQLNRGYTILGHSETQARGPIDPINAQMLAVEKNADIAVFSRNFLGTHTERVAVPVATTTTNTVYSSPYGPYDYYNPPTTATATSTTYAYENRPFQLWNHKTTLLRKNLPPSAYTPPR